MLVEQEKKLKKNLANLTIANSNPITSLGTGLIPFLEHNDANRTLMGANMQRQALPLLKKEKALINTGIETSIIKSSQYTIINKHSGIVKFSNQKKIHVENYLKNINIAPNKSNLTKYKNKLKLKTEIKIQSYQKEEYKLKKFKKSNQNNFLEEKNITQKDEWIKKGQIINEANCTHQGKLALGQNLLIGYMSWDGYNFEDAIVINKSIQDRNILTSIHIKREKIFLIKDEKEDVRFRNNV